MVKIQVQSIDELTNRLYEGDTDISNINLEAQRAEPKESFFGEYVKKLGRGLRNLAYTGVFWAALVGGMEAKADIITWHYEDDFNTTKAESDSYEHTPFYSIHSYHPLPALCHWPEKEVLLFEGSYDGEPAFLAYVFPLDNILSWIDSGNFGIDVSFSDESPYNPYILYELSTGGQNWTEASLLVEGYNQIPLLSSNNAFTYIRLSGTDTTIDNLSVTVSGPEIPEPSTLALLTVGFTGLLSSKYKQKKSKS